MEFSVREGVAFAGLCFEGDDHERGAVEDLLELVAVFLLESFDVEVVADDGDTFGVVERVLDECFELGEAHGVVVADELVHEDNLVVNGDGVRVGFNEELVLGVVLNIPGGGVCGRGAGLVVTDSLL